MRPAVRIGHPDFGKALACRCQDLDTHEHRIQRLRRYSNLGPLGRITFEGSYSDGPRPGEKVAGYRAAFDRAQAYAKQPEGWLVLAGPSGSGKTHIAAAIANACLERDVLASFVVVADLMDHLRSAFAPTSEISYDELFEQVRNAPVLVLDDLGAHSSTPWAVERDGKSQVLLFVNDEAGRRGLASVRNGVTAVTPGRSPEAPVARPTVYELYEQNIGLITPLIAEELKEAERDYPAEWLVDAFRESVAQNKRSWRYVSRILERWAIEGRGTEAMKAGEHGEPGRHPQALDPKEYLRRYGRLTRE